MKFRVWAKPKIGIKVGDIMTRNFVSVKPILSVSDCAREMIKKHVGSLVVQENQVLKGILTEKDIVRASVETVAENSVDGVISPLFYALLGGAPLALCYKAVNTLDSMVGYKNEKYQYFGWAAARLDDIANFIPARISVLFLTLASWLCAKDARQALLIGIRDGRKNPSPNSGIPEAVMAGALGVRLGGMNFYKSVARQKPIIGEGRYPLEPKHIIDSIKIVYTASGLFMAVCVGMLWMLKR